MAKNYETNLCEGSILKKLILFALPIIASNVLQVLFNSADVAVLGILVPSPASDDAVAAVGSNSALINLIVGLFVGISAGANVVIARCVGEKNVEKARRAVGTSIIISVIFGFVGMLVGSIGAEFFLRLTGCNERFIDLAATYLRIYSFGMPIMILYNFTSSILRAVGDTFRPLIFLAVSGVVNIGLNAFFIVVLGKTVEGVAIATVASQGIAAVLALIALVKGNGYAKLEAKNMRIYKKELVEILKIGVPSGLQGCVFSISNVLIISSINIIDNTGIPAVAGNTIAQQFDAFVYQTMNGFAIATLPFISQNYGARNFYRIKRTIFTSLIAVTVLGILTGGGVYLLRVPLCYIMTDTPAAVEVACVRLLYLCVPYFLCGIMDTLSSCMRGLGKSTTAMVVSLTGSCLFRVIWLSTVFQAFQTLEVIYVVYPITWGLTALTYVVLLIPLFKKLKKASEEVRETEERTV
ncbi:MAG: MATE family efflux transporter [Clostridia bacterium]|nr:MATE family efflux transporter [Clostridia bacterium]